MLLHRDGCSRNLIDGFLSWSKFVVFIISVEMAILFDADKDLPIKTSVCKCNIATLTSVSTQLVTVSVYRVLEGDREGGSAEEGWEASHPDLGLCYLLHHISEGYLLLILSCRIRYSF